MASTREAGRFFEVGTGRVPATPLAYWLMGAKQVFTIDLNPYVKAELIRESIDFILENEDEIHELFGSRIDKSRLADLLLFHRESPVSTNSFLQHCHIKYIAPGDATKTGLEEKRIDFHTSHNVFEHIPPSTLKAILTEGNRIINEDGLFVHRIDYSDHFAHSDKSISAINFLQYSDSDWGRFAGNRYMYMNRLRHDDFLTLLEDSGQDILFSSTEVDAESLEILESSTFQLDDKFQSKPKDILSISASWTVSKKRGH